MNIELEWDDIKRNWTLNNRSLDFADVALVDWNEAITLEDVQQIYSETRYITYALIKDCLCVFAWCYRENYLRVISLRKANKREERKYVKN
ncbi:MAG: BrnT family toxin [Rhizobiaceae bacterium]